MSRPTATIPQRPGESTAAAFQRAAYSRTQRITIVGLLVNVLLGAIKLVAGLLGHSGALIADAVESLADIAGSLVIYSGLRIGALPPDQDHPYGHGKAEALSGLVVACILAAAAIGIVFKAIHDIRTPHIPPLGFTLWVLIIVIAIKLAIFAFARKVAHEEHSSAVHVDAGHHVADAITSIAALIGISISLFGAHWFPSVSTRWDAADDWAALLAGGIILFNAVVLARVPLRELMDTHLPEDADRIMVPAREIALKVPGVMGLEKTRTRKAGSRYWLEIHIQVDPQMPVIRAHAVGGHVRSTIREQLPSVADVFVHVEPYA